MSDNTKIEWADATVNAINGCSVVSPGCTNCYAMRLAGTRLRHHPSRSGLTIDSKAGPVWNGEVRLNEEQLMQPLRWKRPRRIFWNAHGDTFHDAVPDEWIDRIFASCAMTPQHTHMILTKRSARMREYFAARRDGDPWAEAADYLADLRDQDDYPTVLEPRDLPLPNVWLGVSAEDQTRADERIPDLLATPAAVRFISAEPLLGPVDLTPWMAGEAYEGYCSTFTDQQGIRRSDLSGKPISGIDWVIAGGESGPGARPMHPDWARSLRDQCAAAGVAFHFKQWGEWRIADQSLGAPPAHRTADFWRVGKARAGRTLDGRTHDEWPA